MPRAASIGNMVIPRNNDYQMNPRLLRALGGPFIRKAPRKWQSSQNSSSSLIAEGDAPGKYDRHAGWQVINEIP